MKKKTPRTEKVEKAAYVIALEMVDLLQSPWFIKSVAKWKAAKMMAAVKAILPDDIP